MNTLVDTYSRPSGAHHVPTADINMWLWAGASALALVVIALLTVPGPLVAPFTATGLFLGALIPPVASIHAAPERRAQARLFAGMLFAIGILAAVLTDLDRVAALLR